MFRDLVSQLVLILVPAISLVIAIVPFIWVKRKLKGYRPITHNSPQPSLTLREGELSASIRNDNTGETGTYPHPSATKPHITSRLWGAFFIGLVGNVVWWWLFDLIISPKASYYVKGTDTSGVMFGFFLYSFFIVITPFIFYKIKHGHFTGKAIVYNLIVSLLTAGVVLGVWIVLAVIAYRGLFEQLN